MNDIELTSREKQVLSLLMQGLSNKDIGAKMFIEDVSVKYHLTILYRKYNVRSRSQLICKLYQKGE